MADSILGDLLVRLGLKTDDFDRNAERSKSRMTSLRGAMQKLNEEGGKVAVTVTGIATALAGGAIALVNSAGEAAREIRNLSQLSSASTREFQRNAAAARSVGVEQDKLADIYKDMQDRVGDFLSTGAGPMADFFENIAPQVGVTAEQFRKLSGPEALQLFVKSLEEANISQNEMTFYMEQIASDSTRLLPLLRDGGRAMRELGDEAERSGQILSDIELDNLAEAKKTVDQLRASLGREFLSVVAENAEQIAELAEAVGDAASAAIKGATAFGKFFGVLAEDPHIELLGQRIELDSQIAALETQLERRQGVQNQATQRMRSRLEELRTRLAQVDEEIQASIRKDRDVDAEGTTVTLRRPNVQLEDVRTEALGEISVTAPRILDQMPDLPDFGAMRKRQTAEALGEVQRFVATEAEILTEAHENRLEILQNAREQELVSEQEYNELREELESGHIARLNEIRKAGLTDLEAFTEMSFRGQASTVASNLERMTAGVATHSKKMFELNKAAGIANAIISTHAGVAKALEAYPPPLSFAMAAAQAAAGFARVQAIKSQTFGGGGGAAPSVAGSTAAPPVSDVGGGGRQTIFVEGVSEDQLFSGKAVRGLLERIEEAQDDGARVKLS